MWPNTLSSMRTSMHTARLTRVIISVVALTQMPEAWLQPGESTSQAATQALEDLGECWAGEEDVNAGERAYVLFS